MKHLVTIAFISACLFSFGQTEMYWNNYSNLNPSMSGFQYQQHANATYTNFYPALIAKYNAVHANYGMRLANHHGVGITYNGDFENSLMNNNIALNYNYQFNLKKAGKLSLGTGMGVAQSKINENAIIFGNYPNGYDAVNYFQLNLGVAYNWKNLFVGFSATNLTPPKQDPLSSYYGPRTDYNIFAQYTFQIAQKFQLTPRVLYTYDNGYQRLQTNLTLTYNQKYSLGLSSESRNGIGVNIGWDIKNKFRVAYMYGITVSKLNNYISGGTHEFSIGYLIKNKSVKCGLRLEPNTEL